jgi:predicted methyltransferase
MPSKINSTCSRLAASVALAFGLAACGGDEPASEVAAAPAERTYAERLDAVLAGEFRDEEERARDGWRHPKETLLFFGVEPDMTVVEVWPGGGWYTNVIAPYLKEGGGVYYAASFDPASSERAASALQRYEESYVAKPEIYGDIRLTQLGADEIAPAGSADVVLTFRNVHNWFGNDTAADNFAKFYAALKPGGVLGVVEHRLGEEAAADTAGGYVKESAVKKLAEDAGFNFEGASEINANPADTKDHPFGVWTLPPVRRSGDGPGDAPADFDRAKYDAIGESDRMTLKFRKPMQVDDALLQ